MSTANLIRGILLAGAAMAGYSLYPAPATAAQASCSASFGSCSVLDHSHNPFTADIQVTNTRPIDITVEIEHGKDPIRDFTFDAGSTMSSCSACMTCGEEIICCSMSNANGTDCETLPGGGAIMCMEKVDSNTWEGVYEDC
jgi:hypothetical protein